MGGVYNLVNAHLYHYAGNNPVKYTDPDGRYDRSAAVAYAHKWSGGNYVAGRNSQYYNYGQNCANFVSQSLFGGKINMSSQWHSYKSTIHRHDDSLKNIWDVTATWSVASEQFDFFSNPSNGYINGDVLNIHSVEDIANAINDSGVQVGDLLYFGEGEDMHATIITKIENGDIMYSANTNSRKDESLTRHLNEDNIRIIRIQDDAN
jgi:hypothetical protein